MAEFSVRSDSVDVEQIMRQIRSRIREKRGADYTEAEIEKLATVKLEKFMDPRGLRSDLVQQFRARLGSDQGQVSEAVLYETHRPMLKKIRRLLNPVLKLFINPAAIQPQAPQSDVLFYEILHNLVVEVTRLGIEVHNMKMRVESMSSRLDFDERRARAFEGSTQQRPQRRPDFQRNQPSQGSSNTPPGQVSYGAPVDATPRPDAPINVTAAPPVFGAREQSGQQSQGQQQGQGQGQAQGQGRPDGQNGGNREGGRRRRRRRRRRPGQNFADQQSMGSGGSTDSTGSAGSAPHLHEQADGFDDGPDDGPDDEGAGNP
jgi:hypothetical protein